jgi:saccharopine dehydrogenase (NADP+, L-glutamate forming)
MADQFVRENSYAPGEPDRVILFVSLKAEQDGKIMFHETWSMDAWGDANGTAMARLVSTPVSFAVESLLAGDIAAGVHPAPHDPKLYTKWLGQVRGLVQYMERLDHIA